MAFDVVKLFVDVFAPRSGDVVTLLVDLPSEKNPDTPEWSARRDMANRWHRDIAGASEKYGMRVNPLVLFESTGAHNQDIPDVGEKQVLMMPQSSVVYRSEVTAVYVVAEDGTVNFRHVRLGSKSDGSQVVLSGLDAGEKVALDPIKAGIVLKQQRQQSKGQQSKEKAHD